MFRVDVDVSVDIALDYAPHRDVPFAIDVRLHNAQAAPKRCGGANEPP
jgi:hypothetical protein